MACLMPKDLEHLYILPDAQSYNIQMLMSNYNKPVYVIYWFNMHWPKSTLNFHRDNGWLQGNRWMGRDISDWVWREQRWWQTRRMFPSDRPSHSVCFKFQISMLISQFPLLENAGSAFGSDVVSSPQCFHCSDSLETGTFGPYISLGVRT